MTHRSTSYPPTVGCYVDSARGVYMVDGIVEIAEASGFNALGCDDSDCDRCKRGCHKAGDSSYTEWGHCLHNDEIGDEATEYMNEHQSVEGCYWGHAETGDWGLWPNDDEEASVHICPTCDAGDPTSVIPYEDCECKQGGQS